MFECLNTVMPQSVPHLKPLSKPNFHGQKASQTMNRPQFLKFRLKYQDVSNLILSIQINISGESGQFIIL